MPASKAKTKPDSDDRRMRDIRLVMSESTYRKIRIEMVRSGMSTPSAVIWALIDKYLPDDAMPGVLASEADGRSR